MEDVFQALASILKAHSEELHVVTDNECQLYVNSHKLDAKKKAIFFGMVKQANGKVAYHLMPVYCNPELLNDISPSLRKKMQGKSCFSFKAVDKELFEELEQLTANGLADYVKNGKV
ncbi:hypothetical protein [Thalassotalea fusca]